MVSPFKAVLEEKQGYSNYLEQDKKPPQPESKLQYLSIASISQQGKAL